MGQTVSHGNLKRTVDFTINDKSYQVSTEIPSKTSLNVFIRDVVKLRGTKAMCLEGGCGVCIVTARIKGQTFAVNSCLVPILICDGWAIRTIEGIGSKQTRYHSIQATLASMNGSQCGYCSPGMVMNLYSLLQEKKLSMKEIENSFGSNICRCTGYRPILSAFKGYATDADQQIKDQICDIEELYKTESCLKRNSLCEQFEVVTMKDVPNEEEYQNLIHIPMQNTEFYKVTSVTHLFAIFTNNPDKTYILHGGNTAHGVYRVNYTPQMFIDLNDVVELHRVQKSSKELTLGGNTTLTATLETFNKYSKSKGFEYLLQLADHLDLVASVAIRNIGTIAGNLMTKHQHREFPSDVFLMLESCGAEIHILEQPGVKKIMTLLEFLSCDMHHKIIYSIVLPYLGNNYFFKSYKITPRAQNAHAHVNAGFLFKLNMAGDVLERPNIIFGGIRPEFTHAFKTEDFLEGKSILNNAVVQSALKILDAELQPDHVLPDYSPAFRKILAKALFYKFVLSIRPDRINSRLRSGATILERELSSGTQDYETDKSLWPLNQPIPKLEALHQTSGEAQYMNDIPPQYGEVFCAFVVTTVPNGQIKYIDAKEALATAGVVAFFTAKDIPGENIFIPASSQILWYDEDEPLFVGENILFAGQPIGVIVAKSQIIAQEAAQKVEVSYKNVLKRPPIITIEDAMALNDNTRFKQTIDMPATRTGNDTKHVIKGVFRCGSQYHFTMEPQTCVCMPVEDGIDVYPSTQYMDLTQVSIARVLRIPNNSINIKVRRLGGAYGSRISRATQIACTCALVCYKLNRPTRFVMTIEGNMMSIGKRFSTRHEYEIGVNDDGLIQYLDSKFWVNDGHSFNEGETGEAQDQLFSGYDKSTWKCAAFETKTELPSNTFCRAPGTTQGLAMAEHMMEHIAAVLGKDPLQVKLINMDSEHRKVLEPMIEEVKRSADYNIRKETIKYFNSANRWKKRGIAVVPMQYPLKYAGIQNALVSIYARDGTVSVSHGGIECGQGINTKIAQVAAHTLGIDLKLVNVKPSNTLVSPNNFTTGGSITSESCALAIMMACKQLVERLDPIKKQMNNPTWQELVLAAHKQDVDLCAHYLMTPKNVTNYPIYGVTIAEVEVDVLTGQHIVKRVDLIEDAGISLSPKVDIGQVEGAFVMGLGYWTSEELIYDPQTAQLTNYRTWNYKPPGAKDIPIDFRVSLRKKSS